MFTNDQDYSSTVDISLQPLALNFSLRLTQDESSLSPGHFGGKPSLVVRREER